MSTTKNTTIQKEKIKKYSKSKKKKSHIKNQGKIDYILDLLGLEKEEKNINMNEKNDKKLNNNLYIQNKEFNITDGIDINIDFDNNIKNDKKTITENSNKEITQNIYYKKLNTSQKNNDKYDNINFID